MQHQIDNDELRDQYQRDPDHKLRLAGFMADHLHRQQHRRGTADRRNEKQHIFFDAPVSLLGGALIMDRYDNRDKIDDDQIDIQNFQNNLGVIK